MLTRTIAPRRRKKATNRSVDERLLDQARRLKLNLSQVFEAGLTEAIRRRQREEWFRKNRATLAPVVVETCFFLAAPEKADLLTWAQRGGIAVVETPMECYPELGSIIARYADRDLDLADAALIWLANASGQNRILTVDERDFWAYRLKQGRRFELLDWF